VRLLPVATFSVGAPLLRCGQADALLVRAGLSLLPLSYFLAFRVRGIFIYFWAAPALCAVIVVLEEGLEVVSDLSR
jgi:hypothetical protein